jgi:hypothetical protein
MQETWPDLPPRSRDALWTLVSDTWDEVASQRYVGSLIESIPRRVRSVVEAQGFWTTYERCKVLKTALLRANILNHILYMQHIVE